MSTHRNNDPVTSKISGRGIRRGGVALRLRVYWYAVDHPAGFIDRDLEEDFADEYAPSSARKRRCELTDDGFIRQMRDRQTGLPVYRHKYGSPHIVWEAVPAGEKND